MRVFVTGATGFVGRALIPRLQRDGHSVVAWVRSPARARGLLGAEVELVHADTAPDGLVGAIERSDAVVNLAGEPLMGGRWKWEPGRSFADLQEKGPYRFWWHNHTFQADGPRTVMEDRVYYTPPLGLFGRLANRVFIRSTLRKIFQYRGDVIRLRFGVS